MRQVPTPLDNRLLRIQSAELEVNRLRWLGCRASSPTLWFTASQMPAGRVRLAAGLPSGCGLRSAWVTHCNWEFRFLHNLRHVAQEPPIDFRELVNLINRRVFLECLC